MEAMVSESNVVRPFAKSFVDEMCDAVDGLEDRRSGVDLPKGQKALVFEVSPSNDDGRPSATELTNEPTGDSIEVQLDFDAEDPLATLARSVDELAARASRR